MRVLAFDVGCRNLAFCLIDLAGPTDAPVIHAWEVADVGSSDAEAVLRFLHGRTDLLDMLSAADSHVVLERQPARSKLYPVQAAITAFYILRCRVERGLKKVSVTAIPAWRKLDGEGVKKGKKAYADRKRAAVSKVEGMLGGGSTWTPWFAGLKKRDDAADALLTAVAYVAKSALRTDRSKVIARKPPPGTTDLTAAHVKYLLKMALYPKVKAQRKGALQKLPAYIRSVPELGKGVKVHFGSLPQALTALTLI